MPRKKPKQKSSIGRKAWAQGHRAEFWAALYLRLKLYRIVARNLRRPYHGRNVWHSGQLF